MPKKNSGARPRRRPLVSWPELETLDVRRHLLLARHLLEYLLVRVFICVIQSLRMETCQRLARGLATLAVRLGVRREITRTNLRHAFPDWSSAALDSLAWDMWYHLFLLVAEIAHLPRKVHETNWRDYARLVQSDEVVRTLLNEQSLLLVTGHFGNFEAGGYVMGVLGFPTYTVARPLDNPFLDRFVNRFRGLTGQHIIPKYGGYEQIAAVLSRGGAMSILADQYAGPKGCWVEFFGRPASTHKAIALLSLQYQAKLGVVYTRRLDRPLQFEMALVDSIDPRSADPALLTVRGMTEWYTRHLEAMIRRDPDQYWWLHHRWKSGRRRKRKKIGPPRQAA